MSIFRKLTIKDLERFHQVSDKTAKKRMRELKNYYNKSTIRVCDLAKYEGYDSHFILSELG